MSVWVCLPCLQALTTIVRRDFFPDIPKLEAQLEFIEASEANDYERLRAISERFPTTIHTPQPTSEWVMGIHTFYKRLIHSNNLTFHCHV